MPNYVKRLINNFRPENYDLHLNIDKDNLTFSGSVKITGYKVGKPSKRLTFHQKDLKITNVAVDKFNKNTASSLAVTRINHHNTLNEIRIHFDEIIYPTKYVVTLDFKGRITNHMDGIYPSFFTEKKKKKTIIATQFESHHARQAFPCIDEPEAKAIFKLTIKTDVKDTVISNTPILETIKENDLQVVSFEPTPIMSSYLVAFACGDLKYITTKTKSGTIVSCYTTPEKIKLAEYSLKVAVKALEFFTDYFKIPYPLKKLDMLALPDFSSGAMENWGLIIYREVCMLTNEKDNNIDSMQQIVLVICHEISHQWFGNLVTMKWWDDLWLNESFASLMEYCACHAIYPEWNIWEQFVAHDINAAKRRDSLSGVQAVHTKVKHPDEISTLFDPAIVYAKGGAILYMLMNYLGEDSFRDSLKLYFKKYAYKNTSADDLWQVMSDTTNQNINTFMKNWLTFPGFPLVKVNWQPGSRKANLNQIRFLIDKLDNGPIKTNEKWMTPLAAGNFTQPTIMTKLNQNIKVKEKELNLFNHNGQSYYLPYYENQDHVELITKSITKLSQIDQFLLLDNYYLFQRNGIASLADTIKLLNYYQQSEDDNVWGSISAILAEVRKIIENDELLKDKLHFMINSLIETCLMKVKLQEKNTDSSKIIKLRSIILSLAASANNPLVIKEMNKLFDEFTSPDDINSNIRNIVYFVAVKKDTNFKKLIKLYTFLTNQEEKEEIAAAISTTKNPEFHLELLEFMKSDQVRRQDFMHFFSYLIRNSYSRQATWDWLTKNWEFIIKEFSSDKSFGFFARIAANVFSHESDLNQYQLFFNDKLKEPSLKRDIILGISEIKNRISWREKNESEITNLLRKI